MKGLVLPGARIFIGGGLLLPGARFFVGRGLLLPGAPWAALNAILSLSSR